MFNRLNKKTHTSFEYIFFTSMAANVVLSQTWLQLLKLASPRFVGRILRSKKWRCEQTEKRTMDEWFQIKWVGTISNSTNIFQRG